MSGGGFDNLFTTVFEHPLEPASPCRAVSAIGYVGGIWLAIGLEFAARVNKEIGLNSDTATGGITVIFKSNLRTGALRRPREDPKPPKQRAEGQ
jgi:hypothetical protein